MTVPKRLIVVVPCVLLAAMILILLVDKFGHPQPRIDSYHFFGGDVRRAILTDKSKTADNPGRPSIPFRPRTIIFESSNGPIDVFVLRFPSGSNEQSIRQMMQLTDELAAGKTPENFVAHGSGERGQVNIGWFPFGYAKYLVLVRSENESDVTLTTHYGS